MQGGRPHVWMEPRETLRLLSSFQVKRQTLDLDMIGDTLKKVSERVTGTYDFFVSKQVQRAEHRPEDTY